MNKNDECDIVKDLSIQYIEDVISQKSKNFIEEHLENCKECQIYYRNMQENISEDKVIEKSKDEYELNHLKKFNKYMRLFKRILSIILILIILIGLVAFIKYKRTDIIINKAYNKIEELKKLDNYKLIQETRCIDNRNNKKYEVKTEYYYKDGKYKLVTGNTTTYYEDETENRINLYNNLKQIDYYERDFIKHEKGMTFDIFTEINSYKNEIPEFFKLALSIKKGNYNDKECYIIRFGNKESHRDVWIDKETFIIMRVTSNDSTNYYEEYIYTLIENATTDEDVDSSVIEKEEFQDYKRTYNKYDEVEVLN